ncbi:unnamed protein product [Umbelopsis vinacea]
MNHTVTNGENTSLPSDGRNKPPHPLPPKPPGPTNQRPAASTTSYEHSVTKNLFKTNVSSQDRLTPADVWHKSVNAGAVVFDFAPVATSFSDDSPMEAIVMEYGPENIKGFRRLSGKYNTCYEVLFAPSKASTLRKQATEIGVEFGGSTIKAQETVEMSAQLTKVKLRNLPLYPSEESLVRVLTQSMGAFGAVRNVSIYKTSVGKGKFYLYSGEGFVMLDTKPKPNNKPYPKLSPFVRIPEWSMVVQARWLDAPPACNYCRQVGHTKNDCPVRPQTAQGLRTCFRCKQTGHLKSECPIIETPPATTVPVAFNQTKPEAPSIDNVVLDRQDNPKVLANNKPAETQEDLSQNQQASALDSYPNAQDPRSIVSSQEEVDLSQEEEESDGGEYLPDSSSDDSDSHMSDISEEESLMPSPAETAAIIADSQQSFDEEMLDELQNNDTYDTVLLIQHTSATTSSENSIHAPLNNSTSQRFSPRRYKEIHPVTPSSKSSQL